MSDQKTKKDNVPTMDGKPLTVMEPSPFTRIVYSICSVCGTMNKSDVKYECHNMEGVVYEEPFMSVDFVTCPRPYCVESAKYSLALLLARIGLPMSYIKDWKAVEPSTTQMLPTGWVRKRTTRDGVDTDRQPYRLVWSTKDRAPRVEMALSAHGFGAVTMRWNQFVLENHDKIKSTPLSTTIHFPEYYPLEKQEQIRMTVDLWNRCASFTPEPETDVSKTE